MPAPHNYARPHAAHNTLPNTRARHTGPHNMCRTLCDNLPGGSTGTANGGKLTNWGV